MLAARGRGRDRRSLGAARSLSRVEACNPLLQAHPTWAWDEHEGREIPTSLTPVSGRLALPLQARPRARPIWAGARGDTHSSAQGPPGLETPTDYSMWSDKMRHHLTSLHKNICDIVEYGVQVPKKGDKNYDSEEVEQIQHFNSQATTILLASLS
jgi:hypothetical protein